MISYKKTLLALSFMALSLAPVNGANACFGWCCGSDDEDTKSEKHPIISRADSAASLVTAAPLLQPGPQDNLRPPASLARRDDSRDSSAADATLSSRMMSGGDMTAVDMSRTSSAAAIPLPRNNDDLIPHLVRVLTEGAYPGITFEHGPSKLVMNFDCKEAGTMQIALVCVTADNTNAVDQGCSGGTRINKQEFPLVSSLIVNTVRDGIHTHYRVFTRTLNAVLQALYNKIEHANFRLSADERLREFALDVRGQSETSFIKLYGVSAPLGHPSLAKRVNAYK